MMRYEEVPGSLGLVRDVCGESILGLTCGTGFYSRQFKCRGAANVLGVDISVEMVTAARDIERRYPLDARYEVGDVAELRPLDRRFDIVLGVQCLSYAPGPRVAGEVRVPLRADRRHWRRRRPGRPPWRWALRW
ncbi:class I SAM-dependent methyltransferase [Streptomyces sp. NPDC059564]|uniref:class I SAM-dependent methyltransferase n=1 Tax=Streptomyces sp. NPDC059564 TaxID=3346865 RepID=UPI0036B6844B